MVYATYLIRFWRFEPRSQVPTPFARMLGAQPSRTNLDDDIPTFELPSQRLGIAAQIDDPHADTFPMIDV